jgi:hypothetical protein
VDHVAFPLLVGGVTTALATAYGLLPERLDVTHVFAAYGAGAVLGEVVGARRRLLEPAAYMRRYGGLAMTVVAGFWARGLFSGIL